MRIRNKETGKSSIIHLDRIKELREDLEENEYTAGMQQGQQQNMRGRPKVVSYAKENEAKHHGGARVARGPAGAAAAVLAQDRDIGEQVEAEQGKMPRTKPKKRKQPEMQSGWLPRVDPAGKKGVRTRKMGLQVDYLDDHRTDPAEEKRRLLWAEESRKEEEEFRDYPDYMQVSRPAGPTEAEQQADGFFESATSGPAWQE
jgi:hypothetical protein